MEKLIILLTILTPFFLGAQTSEIEKSYINKLFKDDPSTKTKAVTFNNLLNKGVYPNLPYDTLTKKVEWKHVFYFEGMKKKDIYNRVKEWSARNFRSFDAVADYDDYESGKFMVKGFFNLPLSFKYNTLFFQGKGSIAIKCFSIYVFTIKDNALKLEVVRAENEISTEGYLIGSTYTPSSTTRGSIMNTFPLFRQPENLWEGYMEFYNQMNNEFNLTFDDVEKYIREYKEDYNFGK